MTNEVLNVLFAVASELAQEAKSNLPELRTGEQITSECFTNGVYRRETRYKGRLLISEYDFKQRNSRAVAAEEVM